MSICLWEVLTKAGGGLWAQGLTSQRSSQPSKGVLWPDFSPGPQIRYNPITNTKYDTSPHFNNHGICLYKDSLWLLGIT